MPWGDLYPTRHHNPDDKNFIVTAVRTSDVSYYYLALLEFVYLRIIP